MLIVAGRKDLLSLNLLEACQGIILGVELSV